MLKISKCIIFTLFCIGNIYPLDQPDIPSNDDDGFQEVIDSGSSIETILKRTTHTKGNITTEVDFENFIARIYHLGGKITIIYYNDRFDGIRNKEVIDPKKIK